MNDITSNKPLQDQIYQNIVSLVGRQITQGIVAGGSVAGWIIENVHKKSLPVKDIDLFLPTGRNTSFDCYPMRCSDVGFTGSLNDIPRIDQIDERSYAIVSTKRQGILNTVQVAFEAEYADSTSMTTALLEGFDLNCCQAAMNMQTRQLIVTEDFLRFLRDYQLKVTSPVTPHHTVMRLPKKAKDLGCYVDYEQEYRLLALVPALINAKEDSNSWYMRCFSSVHIPEYLAHRAEIDPYFILQTYRRGAKSYAESQTLEHDIRVAGLYEFVPRFALEVPEELRSIQIPTAALRKYYDALCRPTSKGTAKKNKAVAQKPQLLPYLLLNGNYTKCDMHDKHLDRIITFLRKHPMMRNLFAALQANIAQQLQLIKAMKRMASTLGDAAYGLAENAEDEDFRELHEGLKQTQWQDTAATVMHWLGHLNQRRIERGTRQLTQPLDISHLQLPEGAALKELTCQNHLDSEGLQMKHCVAGYGPTIEKSGNAIFSIDYQGERTTLQIADANHWMATMFTEKLKHKYTIIQHKGYGNSLPSKAHNLIARALIEHLNSGSLHSSHADETPKKEQLTLCT